MPTLLSEFPFPVELTRRARSRRISIRINPKKRCVVLNVPKRVSLDKGIDFLKEKAHLVEKNFAKYKGSHTQVKTGMKFTILGEEFTLQHDPTQRGIHLENGLFIVGGGEEFLARRIKDALRIKAKKFFSAYAREVLHRHPELKHRKITVAVRDMVSQWGSCSRAGRLCFNWRLLLAPRYVAEYLVCHEAAHLMHHNHGTHFWKLVHTLFPETEKAKRWLRLHGPELYQML